MKAVLIMLFTSLIFVSCNRVFLPERNRVLFEQTGYIFEQHNQVLFIPMNIEGDFLSQINGSIGYRIYEFYGYDQVKHAQGDTMTVNLHYEDRVIKEKYSIKEKVVIVPATIVYTREVKRKPFQNAEIEFDYNGKVYRFRGQSDYYTQVYQIIGVAKKG